MSREILLSTVILAATAASPVGLADDASRQELVRERSADVMPFDLKATTHVFIKTQSGGVQRVVAKEASDAEQTQLIRTHLKNLVARFRRGDFSGPAHVHGTGMPGLAALKAATPGELRINYHDVAAGGEVEYASDRPKVVDAVHQWFDAQLVDHGPDAVPGHDHSMHSDH